MFDKVYLIISISAVTNTNSSSCLNWSQTFATSSHKKYCVCFVSYLWYKMHNQGITDLIWWLFRVKMKTTLTDYDIINSGLNPEDSPWFIHEHQNRVDRFVSFRVCDWSFVTISNFGTWLRAYKFIGAERIIPAQTRGCFLLSVFRLLIGQVS